MTPARPGVVAVDLGGTKTTAALVLPGPVVRPVVRFATTVATPSRSGPAAVVEAVASLVAGVLADAASAGLAVPRLLGVGTAGVVDRDSGTIVSATDAIPGWAGTPLAALLGEATGLRVRVLNDVHAHAIGEATYGAGARRSPVLLVAAGTGVGGALAVDGQVGAGARGASGHLGHVPAPEADGLPCPCGGTGHLEALASGPGLAAAYQRTSGRPAPVDARSVVAAAGAGDPTAAEVVALSARALGRAVGGWVNLLDPEVVVVTGGLASAGDLWWDALRDAAAGEYVDAVRSCRVVPAALGTDAALVGAAAFASDTDSRAAGDAGVVRPPRARRRDPVAALRGGLVVSCQAYPGEPLRDPTTTARVAASVVAGGAVGVRVQGLEDIARVVAAVDVPVIGLWKDGEAGRDTVHITPTLEHARAVRDAGADVVALDGTARPRPDGLTLAETVAALAAEGSTPVMADCSTVQEAVAAVRAGAAMVGTTLAGYTGSRAATPGPDLDLVRAMVAALPGVPVVAEGRVHRPPRPPRPSTRGRTRSWSAPRSPTRARSRRGSTGP